MEVPEEVKETIKSSLLERQAHTNPRTLQSNVDLDVWGRLSWDTSGSCLQGMWEECGRP